MQELASLESVKAWLGEESGLVDPMLMRLIRQASQFILNETARETFFKASQTDSISGNSSTAITLSNFPVTSVESLYIGNQTMTPAPTPPQVGAGYTLEPWNGYPPGGPQLITLNGYNFPVGNQNIRATYTSGFFITDEPHVIGALPSRITVDAPKGPWGRDDGVTLDDGTALQKVPSNPASGEYSVLGNGVYQFSPDDEDEAVLISYSYIPADIEQACIEIVTERYRYRTRAGQQSVSSAGQVTTSFNLAAMPDYVKEIIGNYKRSSILC